VAEDFLDAAQVGAAFEQMGRGGMADAVRARIPAGAGLAEPGVDDPAGGARI
jgi:hypothetical protein